MAKHRSACSSILAMFFTLLVIVASNAYCQECKALYGKGKHLIRLATGSPGELGLLEVLCNTFNENHDTRFCWIKAGSGKSLKLLKEKRLISSWCTPQMQKKGRCKKVGQPIERL